MASNQISVNLSPKDAAKLVCDYVIDGSVTGALIDNYTVYDCNGVLCLVLVFEKYYLRMGSRLTLTVVIDNLNGITNVRSIGGGGGDGFFTSFNWGTSSDFSNCAVDALREYIIQ